MVAGSLAVALGILVALLVRASTAETPSPDAPGASASAARPPESPGHRIGVHREEHQFAHTDRDVTATAGTPLALEAFVSSLVPKRTCPRRSRDQWESAAVHSRETVPCQQRAATPRQT